MKNKPNGSGNGKSNGPAAIRSQPTPSAQIPHNQPAQPNSDLDQLELSELAPEEQPRIRVPSRGEDIDPRIARHRAQCTVCKHPCHELIDIEILDWASPKRLVQTFDLRSERTVYRHANFFGLLAKRRTSHIAALDHIIEQVREVYATPSSIVAAIRLSAQLQRRLPRAESPRSGPSLALSSAVTRSNGADHPSPNPETIHQPASPEPANNSQIVTLEK